MNLRTIQIFISYSSKDKDSEYFDNVKKCIDNAPGREVVVWDDGQISLGTEWDAVIKSHLNDADIILLLISRDFLKSGYINNIELKSALERHERKECRVIPVFIRNCLVAEQHPEIMKLQGYPKGKFFSDIDKGIDKYYTEFEQAIKNVINEIRTQAEIDKAATARNKTSKEAETVKKQESAEKRILVAEANSDLGKTLKDFLLAEAQKEIEFKKWDFSVEAANLLKPENKDKMEQSVYTIHIFTSVEEIAAGEERDQFELASSTDPGPQRRKPILWISNNALVEKLPLKLKSNKMVIGTKPADVINLVKIMEIERQQLIQANREQFSPQTNVYMIYDFEKDHTNSVRIKLKETLESKQELVNYFSPPNPSFTSIEDQLKLCKGAIIFYGLADANWYCYWQSEIQKLRTLRSRAVCLSDPDKDDKLKRDISRTAFLVINDEQKFDSSVTDFITKLKEQA